MKMKKFLSGDVWLVLTVIALIAFPWGGSYFYTDLAGKVLIMGIFAMSLNLLVGYTGLVSFGHAAYFGLGAYTLGIVIKHLGAISIWWSLPVAMVVAGVFALITGLLVLRTRGIYFIMVTLAFAQLVYYVFHDTHIAGASDGQQILYRPTLKLGDTVLANMDDQKAFYYFALCCLVLVYLFLRVVLRSSFGHSLQGIKVNEHRMRALGFPIFRYQLASFILAGMLAGMAGYLSAMQFGMANPEMISWHMSGAVLMMVIMGGMTRLYGPILGAAVFVLLQDIFADQNFLGAAAPHWQLTMGIVVVLVAMYLPDGVAGLLARIFGRKRSAEPLQNDEADDDSAPAKTEAARV
jgi:branched-chain amino acid transport system permease protein